MKKGDVEVDEDDDDNGRESISYHRSMLQLRNYCSGPGLRKPTMAAKGKGEGVVLSHHTPVM
jgi:hypothetical protein